MNIARLGRKLCYRLWVLQAWCINIILVLIGYRFFDARLGKHHMMYRVYLDGVDVSKSTTAAIVPRRRVDVKRGIIFRVKMDECGRIVADENGQYCIALQSGLVWWEPRDDW